MLVESRGFRPDGEIGPNTGSWLASDARAPSKLAGKFFQNNSGDSAGSGAYDRSKDEAQAIDIGIKREFLTTNKPKKSTKQKGKLRFFKSIDIGMELARRAIEEEQKKK